MTNFDAKKYNYFLVNVNKESDWPWNWLGVFLCDNTSEIFDTTEHDVQAVHYGSWDNIIEDLTKLGENYPELSFDIICTVDDQWEIEHIIKLHEGVVTV